MGDLNFRIKILSREEVFEKIEENKIDQILNYDGLILSGFYYHQNKSLIDQGKLG